MKSSHPLRFDHAAIPVHDADSAYRLFTEVLELPLLAAYEGDDWDGAPWLMMIFGLADDGQIALCARAGTRPHPAAATDLPHFALSTGGRPQLREWEKKLTAAGFSVRHEDHGDQQSIYFDDRNGLTWEITTARAESSSDPQGRSVVEQWIKRYSAS